MSTPYVRKMTELDLPRVGQLSEALGYPVLPADLERRFLLLARRSDEVLLVAELQAQVAGWVHAKPQLLLESPPFIEIVALVVDAKARRTGVGRALVADVARWARQAHFNLVRVRSNVSRQESHQFYPALGFKLLKTQHTYVLEL